MSYEGARGQGVIAPDYTSICYPLDVCVLVRRQVRRSCSLNSFVRRVFIVVVVGIIVVLLRVRARVFIRMAR